MTTVAYTKCETVAQLASLLANLPQEARLHDLAGSPVAVQFILCAGKETRLVPAVIPVPETTDHDARIEAFVEDRTLRDEHGWYKYMCHGGPRAGKWVSLCEHPLHGWRPVEDPTGVYLVEDMGSLRWHPHTRKLLDHTAAFDRGEVRDE